MSDYGRAPLHAHLTYDARSLSLTTAVVEGDDLRTEVSVLDLDTGAQEVLGDGYGATWSPWGRRLAWVDTATESLVIGEPDRTRAPVPGTAGASSAPAWSPDGAWLAYTAALTTPVDRSQPFSWTRPYLDFDGLGPLDAPPQIMLVPVYGTEAPRALTDDAWRWSILGWSPDASRLAVVNGFGPTDHATGQQLHLVGIDGTRVTPDLPIGRAVAAEWLTDTRLVVLIFEPTAGAEPQLFLVEGEQGERVTPLQADGLGGDVYGDHPGELCDTIEHVLLAVDQDRFLIRTVFHGALGIAVAQIRGSKVAVAPYVGGARSCSPVGFSNGRLVMTTVAPDQWPQLTVVDWASAEERVVARFAEQDPALDVERFTVTTDACAPIDAWCLRPARASGLISGTGTGSGSSDERLPAAVLVHGGPNYAYGESFSLDALALCQAGFAVLYANVRGSTGTSTEFGTATHGDWADGPSRDVLAVVEEATARGWIDPTRVGIAGNSYGGYLAAWLSATTTRFAAAVAENPVTDLASMYFTSDIGPGFFSAQMQGTALEQPERYREQSPLYRARESRTPTLFVTGTEDRRCPAAQAWSMHRELCAVGTPSEVLVLPGGSHEGSTYGPPALRRAHDEALVEWMTRWVLPARSGRA